MRTLILDATIWLAAHDPRDDAHDAARALVLGTALDLAALDLTVYEVANVAAAKWHDPEAAERLARLVAVAVDTRLIRVGADLLSLAVQLSAEHGLSVYDGAYAAASKQSQWTLVSTDSDLVRPGLGVTPSDLG